MELLRLLLRRLIEKPHGTLKSRKEKRISSNNTKIGLEKADSAGVGTMISHPTMPAARELITWQTL